MPSENAKAVAKEVLKAVRNRTRVNMGKIIREQGYAKSISLHPDKVVNTKSYQDTIQPLVIQLEAERNAVIERLKVTRGKAKYRDLMDGLDKLTKNIQLIQGKATSNIALPISILGHQNVISANNSNNKNTEPTEEN